MLAYILFLIVCLIYSFISKIFEWEFHSWTRIITAATIASFSFSISSTNKFWAKKHQTNYSLAQKCLATAQKLKAVQQKNRFNNTDNRLDSTIQSLQEQLVSIEKSVKKEERKAFIFDVLGYFSFLIVLTFDVVFYLIYVAQDAYTLAAFINILIIEYIETVKSDRHEDVINELVNKTEDIIKQLEELTNGKTQNALPKQS